MNLFIIDGIGPFFRGYTKRKINWSKLPFEHLATEGAARGEQFSQIRDDMKEYVAHVSGAGYNAITLDDVVHLTDHPWYEAETRSKIVALSTEFSSIFDIVWQAGMKVYVTMDVFSSTAGLDEQLQQNEVSVDEFLVDLLQRFFARFPEVAGVIIRIGESDGLDVEGIFKSRLHLKTAGQLNALLKSLLPVFENHDKQLILRTWTVGAYEIGDLMWHRDTFAGALQDIDSNALIFSMKHGESDFFRFLPLNRNFFRTDLPKIIELQTKREYEGCGEIPSFIGFDHERYSRELASATNVVGVSVWCQTGGWVPFRRLAFIGSGSIWTEINTLVTISLFKNGLSIEQAVKQLPASGEHPYEMMELLRLSDEVVRELYYHHEFARQKLFFRRVRIPPLIGVYWNTIFVNHSLKKVLRFFVKDAEACIRSGRQALVKIERMEVLAKKLGLPVEDIRFMYDTLSILALAREYFYLPYSADIGDQLKEAKRQYKKKYPRKLRQRYAVRLNFDPFRFKKTFLNWSFSVLLRRQRGYRLIDQIFTIHLLSYVYRMVSSRRSRWIPRFARESAMGVDTIFK